MRARIVGGLAGLLVPVALATVTVAQPRYDGPWPYHWGWGPWGLGMGIGMLVFWGLVIAAIVAVVRWIGRGRPGEEAPVELLRRRYARGELSREEFERMRRDLA